MIFSRIYSTKPREILFQKFCRRGRSMVDPVNWTIVNQHPDNCRSTVLANIKRQILVCKIKTEKGNKSNLLNYSIQK